MHRASYWLLRFKRLVRYFIYETLKYWQHPWWISLWLLSKRREFSARGLLYYIVFSRAMSTISRGRKAANFSRCWRIPSTIEKGLSNSKWELDNINKNLNDVLGKTHYYKFQVIVESNVGEVNGVMLQQAYEIATENGNTTTMCCIAMSHLYVNQSSN